MGVRIIGLGLRVPFVYLAHFFSPSPPHLLCSFFPALSFFCPLPVYNFSFFTTPLPLRNDWYWSSLLLELEYDGIIRKRKSGHNYQLRPMKLAWPPKYSLTVRGGMNLFSRTIKESISGWEEEETSKYIWGFYMYGPWDSTVEYLLQASVRFTNRPVHWYRLEIM